MPLTLCRLAIRKPTLEIRSGIAPIPYSRSGGEKILTIPRIEEQIARIESQTTKKRRPRKPKNASSNNANDAGSPVAGGAGSPDANGDGDPATPAPVSSGRQTQATQRKCANCGRVGHIKTNKKLVNPFSLCKHCGLSLERKEDGFGRTLAVI